MAVVAAGLLGACGAASTPSNSSEHTQGGLCVLPDPGTPVESLPGYPVGRGVQPNVVASTFVDRPYELWLGDGTWLIYSSITLGAVSEGPAHGTLTAGEDGVAIYTPNPGYAGTDEAVFRVEFGPPDGVPMRDFLLEQHPDGSGAELGRLLITVLPSEPLGLPPCDANCAEVEVVPLAGFGYPVQFMTKETYWQVPGYPGAPACEVEHWQPGGIALQSWGIAMGKTGHPQLIQDGDWSVWSWDPAVFGECSGGEVGTVRYLQPERVTMPRQQLDEWCRVMGFVRTGATVDLVTDDEFVDHAAPPLDYQRDWPVWADDEVSP